MSNGRPDTGRDRDPAGRARNARPRDATGRPLPRTATGVAQLPEGPALPPAEALVHAQALLDGGRPFSAHEVLEATWKAAAADERELWRGLAQLAVGLTHAQRGNSRGAQALLRRGAGRLSAYVDRPRYSLDVADLVRYAAGLADRIEATGLPTDPPPPRLVRPSPPG